MKVLIFTILIMCNFAHATAPTFYDEQLELAKTSATKGVIASGALVPFYWSLLKKSNIQLGKPGGIKYPDALKSGFKAIPNVASTLSIQFFTGDLTKSILRRNKVLENETYLEVIGCVSGALFSAPWYAVMNGKTMGLTRTQAFSGFFKNPFSTGWPIVGRESCFLLGVQASGPFSRAMQKQFGENGYVENTSCFASGFAGSISGHLFDTILTYNQAKIPWQWKDLMKGGGIKGIGIGGFAVLLHNLMKQKEKDEAKRKI